MNNYCFFVYLFFFTCLYPHGLPKASYILKSKYVRAQCGYKITIKLRYYKAFQKEIVFFLALFLLFPYKKKVFNFV